MTPHQSIHTTAAAQCRAMMVQLPAMIAAHDAGQFPSYWYLADFALACAAYTECGEVIDSFADSIAFVEAEEAAERAEITRSDAIEARILRGSQP